MRIKRQVSTQVSLQSFPFRVIVGRVASATGIFSLAFLDKVQQSRGWHGLCLAGSEGLLIVLRMAVLACERGRKMWRVFLWGHNSISRATFMISSESNHVSKAPTQHITPAA